MDKKLQELKYVVLPGKFPVEVSSQELHNKSFLFWKNFWNRIFKEKNIDHKVNADDFWRQDIIGLIMHKNEIVGQIMYSFFHLKSLTAQNHSYLLKYYNEEFFDKLKQRNVQTIMAMESIAIAPHWRKEHTGVSLASVFFGLALLHQKTHNIDTLIGPARKKTKTPETLHEFGGETLVANVNLYDEPADLVAILKDKAVPHADTTVNFLVQRLWNQREDSTQELPILRKTAA